MSSGAFMKPGVDSTGAGAAKPSYLVERRRHKRDRGDDTQRAAVKHALVGLFVSNGGAVTGKRVYKWFASEVRPRDSRPRYPHEAVAASGGVCAAMTA